MAPPKHQITQHTSTELIELFANRRSYYNLQPTSSVPDTKIQSIIEQVLLKTPSAFNSQTVRIVLALNASHRKIWDITGSQLKNRIGEERYNSGTKSKIDGFRNAHGTVLFYTNTTEVDALKGKFKSYAEHFEPWAEQTSGMHQVATWVALEAEGLGANLQHYNPLIDAEVAAAFDVPGDWLLRCQLVFGDVGGDGARPDEKEKKPFSETLKVFGVEQ